MYIPKNQDQDQNQDRQCGATGRRWTLESDENHPVFVFLEQIKDGNKDGLHRFFKNVTQCLTSTHNLI